MDTEVEIQGPTCSAGRRLTWWPEPRSRTRAVILDLERSVPPLPHTHELLALVFTHEA